MEVVKRALAILQPRDRRSGAVVLFLTVIRGFTDVLGVAIIFPFLGVLSDPDFIEDNAFTSRVYDFFEFQSTDSFMLALGICVIVVLVTSSLMKAITLYATIRWVAMRRHRLSMRLISTYLRQSYEVLLNRHSAVLCSHILSETQRVIGQVFRPIADIFGAVVSVVLILSLVAFAEPVVTLVALVTFGGAYAVIFIVLRSWMRDLGFRLLDVNHRRHSLLWEALGGAKQIKLLNREAGAVSAFGGSSAEFARLSTTTDTLRAMPRFALEALAFSGIVGLTLFFVMRGGGASSASLGDILPTLGLFLFAGYRLMPSLSQLYSASASIRLAESAVSALETDLAEEGLLPPLRHRAPEPLRLSESLEFRRVSYQYPGAQFESLKDINLSIRRGMKIGIIGATGSGKTTLIDVLMGLLKPSSGEIRVDGRVLDSESTRAWRESVGYVAQDIFLSDASVARNIAFGLPEDEADMDKVIASAKAAQIHSFVMSELKDGYNTEVGEDGVRLSGGQRQRIGIARALYGGAEVLVFDEATSALDNTTEHLVMDEIERLSKEHTIILVAHRLSTVRKCDLIVTLEGGRVVATGNPDATFGIVPDGEAAAHGSADRVAEL
ncbi:MAG: ABC transporter ATP-binding protein [Pseudomonadota bacterium]